MAAERDIERLMANEEDAEILEHRNDMVATKYTSVHSERDPTKRKIQNTPATWTFNYLVFSNELANEIIDIFPP